MTQILAIAPYQSMATALTELTAERDDVSLDSFVGDLDEALVYLNQDFLSKSYDVIISRGGTAMLIREHTHIPVVEIEVSILDTLCSVKLVEQTGRPFVTIGFSNITSAARVLADVLNYDLEIYEITDTQSAREILSVLAESKRRVTVLGDNMTVAMAGKLGMDWLLIDSGRESLEKAINSAVELTRSIRSLESAALMSRSILERSPQTVAVFNLCGCLCYLNHTIADLTPKQITELLQAHIDEVYAEKTLHIKKRLKPYRFDIYARLFQGSDGEYAAFYLEETVVYSPRSLQGLISEDNAEEVASKETLAVYPPSYLHETLSQAEQVFSPERPLVIYGEAGTGKDCAVENIYLRLYRGRMPMVTIYCPLLTESNWEKLIHDPNSPLYGSGNLIFFKSVHTLTLDTQRKLDHFISYANLLTRNCVISSSRLKLSDMVVSSTFVQSLYNKLESSALCLPPLRERKDELKGYALHFLGVYNSRCGKHIVGFRDDAIELLLSHNWRMNMEELRQVVKKLVIACDSNYIPGKLVRPALLGFEETDATTMPIDLTKTMDEIELDIINRVLISENMSYSQAAARLGISRSTIWRKIGRDKG